MCRMYSNRLAHDVIDWTPRDFKRKWGHPRVSWTSIIQRDLDLMGVTWEQAKDLTRDRTGETVLPE